MKLKRSDTDQSSKSLSTKNHKPKRSDTEQSFKSLSTKKVVVTVKTLNKQSPSISPSKRILNKHIVPDDIATKLVQDYKQKLDH